MSMELFKSKSDLIKEINTLEDKVIVLNAILRTQEKDLKELKELNQEQEKAIERLKKLKFTNQPTFQWR